jgi:hypothetical protein
MVLKKVLIIGLLVLGIAAGAVLLFFAGDHDEGYPDAAASGGETSRVELQSAPSQRGAAPPEAATRGSAFRRAPALARRLRGEQTRIRAAEQRTSLPQRAGRSAAQPASGWR